MKTTATKMQEVRKSVGVSQQANNIIRNVYGGRVWEGTIDLITREWGAFWEEFCQEVESKIIASSFSFEKKTKGLALLHSVDNNIAEILPIFSVFRSSLFISLKKKLNLLKFKAY
jgi:hypothetical protein